MVLVIDENMRLCLYIFVEGFRVTCLFTGQYNTKVYVSKVKYELTLIEFKRVLKIC